MKEIILGKKQQRAITTSVEAVIRIGVLLLITLFCLQLLQPFLIPVLWGAIIAVALYPIFLKVRGWLGGRDGIAASLICLILIAAILGPAIGLSGSMFDAIRGLTSSLEAGELNVPPPPPGVMDWPVIGEQAYGIWSQASDNLVAFLEAFKPQALAAARSAVGLLASAGGAVLFTIISLIIAGAFMAYADSCVNGLKAFASRLAGPEGEKFVTSSGLVVRSVATGVIGVAVIQATLGLIGFVLAGVPLAIVWTLIFLVLSIAQVPGLVVMLPIIAYVLATSDGLTAILFTIWGLFVAVCDGFLKPLLLGRGVNIPTLVILLGAIGGMIVLGIIGLFVGAVVLAIGWELLVSWIQGEVDHPELEPAK